LCRSTPMRGDCPSPSRTEGAISRYRSTCWRLPGADMDTALLSPKTQELKAKVGEASAFLRKLSNPDRLLVACALVDSERSVRDLEDSLGIRQPGLSQQLAELREAGLIVGRKEGKQV